MREILDLLKDCGTRRHKIERDHTQPLASMHDDMLGGARPFVGSVNERSA